MAATRAVPRRDRLGAGYGDAVPLLASTLGFTSFHTVLVVIPTLAFTVAQRRRDLTPYS